MSRPRLKGSDQAAAPPVTEFRLPPGVKGASAGRAVMATEIDLVVEEKEPRQRVSARPYDRPAGGWGSAKSVARSLLRERVVASAPPALLRQNKPDGFACVSCAWAKPAEPHPPEFCEVAAKATTWDTTTRHVPDELFAAHTVRALETWADPQPAESGRLTRPM